MSTVSSHTLVRTSPYVPYTHTAPAVNPPPERGRRILNIVVALLGLLLLAPLMLIIAVLVKLTSPGPILYRQTRVGIDRRNPTDVAGNARRHIDFGGRPFTMYKFRTMAVPRPGSAEVEVWAKPNDPRVTRLGRILRWYRLDELPQLYNVLKGDMNVVGPRPEQPTIFARLRDEVDAYPYRQRVRPGITGWAQINHCYDRSVDDVRRKLELDLEYVRRATAAEDFRIMVRTIPVMLLKQGAC